MAEKSRLLSSETAQTIIGSKTKFRGRIVTDKPVIIAGFYDGTLDASGTVIIAKGGEFKGTVKCGDLQLYGKGSGNAICTNTFAISESGYFEGDVTTKDLLTVKGSIINGKIIITR